MPFERTVEVKLSFVDAVVKTREALAAHGFGVLTEIDMQATLLAKRQVDIGPYVILGACSPALAEGALTADPRIGVLLPCSVVVRAVDAARCRVHVFDPDLIPSLVETEGLTSFVDDASQQIAGALADLAI